jgi:hypothetical protein
VVWLVFYNGEGGMLRKHRYMQQVEAQRQQQPPQKTLAQQKGQTDEVEKLVQIQSLAPADTIPASDCLAWAASGECISRNTVVPTKSLEVPGMDDWVVLLTINSGYFDFFLNWWAFYSRLDLDYQVVVVAEDDNAFRKINALGLPKVVVERSAISVEGAADYDTKQYHALVSSRPTYLLRYLRKGKNLIYTDGDTVWLKDPAAFFKDGKRAACTRKGGERVLCGTEGTELWAQIDNPDWGGFKPYYCTGLMAIKGTNQTVSLMETWESRMKKNPQLNQPVFNKELDISPLAEHTLGLPKKMFPNGKPVL